MEAMKWSSLLCIFHLLIAIEGNPVTEVSLADQSQDTIATTASAGISAEDITTEITTTEFATVGPSGDSATDCSHCIPPKYLKHFYAKGCKPVYDDYCKDCPKMFDCDKKVEVILANDECLYNGTKYKIGESVPVANPCQVCQCGYGFTHRFTAGYSSPFTTIHCITIECPEYFAVHTTPVTGLERDFETIRNCYDVYVPNKCCSVAKKCPEKDPTIDEKICHFENKTYRIGEKMLPNEDKCKVCICDDDWQPTKGLNNSGCYEVQCNLEIYRELVEGCIPIYHEKTCCPVDYYCPEREQPLEEREQCTEPVDSGPCVGSFKRFFYDGNHGLCHPFEYSGCGGNGNNFRSLEECQRNCLKTSRSSNETSIVNNTTIETSDDDRQYCSFNDVKYKIGEKLDIGQKCVDCVCRISPEFTCIQQSCPSPPFQDCKVSYNPLSCCPQFDCNYNKTDGTFNPLSCPTPLCDRSCVFETYPDRCPTCVCKPTKEESEEPDYDLSDVK